MVEEYGISGRNADPLAGAQDFSGSDHFDHIGICAHTAAVGLDTEPGFWDYGYFQDHDRDRPDDVILCVSTECTGGYYRICPVFCITDYENKGTGNQ